MNQIAASILSLLYQYICSIVGLPIMQVLLLPILLLTISYLEIFDLSQQLEYVPFKFLMVERQLTTESDIALKTSKANLTFGPFFLYISQL
jgi:hypothetical protein